MRAGHVLALVLSALLVLPASAGAVSRATPTGPAAAKPYFDSRAGDRSRAARTGSTVAAARPTERTRRARAGLRRNLGSGAVLKVDPLSGTPRQLLRTDGALSGPRGGDRVDIALDFARANRETLGLDVDDLDGLDARRGPSSSLGLTVVHFRQLYRGIPAFDNDMRVAVDRAGRVLSVAGAPRHDLSVPSIEPSLSGAEALARLQRDVGVERSLPVTSGPDGARRTTNFKGGDFARLVLFGAADGAKLAWHVTYRATSTAFYDAVVDANSGAILYRQNLTKADGLADVYPNHPDAGPALSVDLQSFGLPANATTLDGAFSRQWADLDDDNTVDAGEETTPNSGTDFNHPFTPFAPAAGGCTATNPCAWDTTNTTTRAETRTTNRLQNGVQAFYLVSRYHDHLAGTAIGFNAASGNFEKAGGDAVETQTDDGAVPGPDNNHLNNANMSTPPDGNPPTMQMYLFRGGGFRSINGGDDSGVVWHEYTHGLSNRLVTNADGSGALSSAHAGAMGEAWSDWYASDLQVRDGFKNDTAAAGEIDIGDYSDADPHTLRSQALDCPVTPVDPLCPGGADTLAGGYTLGDFGKIVGGPEVHADGEIWAETLWDLRRALPGAGMVPSDLAERLVTDGMRLSPPEPSMLDMRNAILAADQADTGGANHDLLWEVFRNRGMGYFAAATDGSDTEPVEDFTAPPAPAAPKGTATGVVTDSASGLPIAGVRVGFGGVDTFVDETDASGRFTIPNMPAGSYPELSAFPPAGYIPDVTRDVVITANATTTRDIALARNWAALGAGAQVAQVSENSSAPLGCGVDKAFDESQATGWSAWNPDSANPDSEANGDPTVTIRLPDTVNVTGFLIDPTATCFDDATASTREYRVETAAEGGPFRPAVDGTGTGGFTTNDLNRLNRRDPAGGSGQGTDLVKITLLSPQGTGGSGADFIDLTEVEVLGAVPNTLPTGSLAVNNAHPAPGEAITFDATSFTDRDSAITGYDWDFDGNGSVDRTTPTATTSFAYGVAGAFNAKVAVTDFRGGAGTASALVTVAAPTPPGPPAGPPATPAPLPSLSVPRRGTGGTIRPSVRCALRCSVRAKLVVSRATARKLKLKKRTLVTFKRTLTTTKKQKLRLRLPAKVRRAAKRAGLKTIPARLTIKATYAGGRSKTLRKAVRIRL